MQAKKMVPFERMHETIIVRFADLRPTRPSDVQFVQGCVGFRHSILEEHRQQVLSAIGSALKRLANKDKTSPRNRMIEGLKTLRAGIEQTVDRGGNAVAECVQSHAASDSNGHAKSIDEGREAFPLPG